MDVTQALLTALNLLGLGMGFVFLFLGLLMIAVNLIAKYTPADIPVTKQSSTPKKPTPVGATQAEINPRLVAAISSAVSQYHKSKTA
ncbi:MAG: OadG family transporter subunit [Psychromonas sp.]